MLDKDQIEGACFRFKVYDRDLLIALDGLITYEIEKIKDDIVYNLIEESDINSFRTFKC